MRAVFLVLALVGLVLTYYPIVQHFGKAMTSPSTVLAGYPAFFRLAFASAVSRALSVHLLLLALSWRLLFASGAHAAVFILGSVVVSVSAFAPLWVFFNLGTPPGPARRTAFVWPVWSYALGAVALSSLLTRDVTGARISLHAWDALLFAFMGLALVPSLFAPRSAPQQAVFTFVAGAALVALIAEWENVVLVAHLLQHNLQALLHEASVTWPAASFCSEYPVLVATSVLYVLVAAEDVPVSVRAVVAAACAIASPVAFPLFVAYRAAPQKNR